MPETATAATDLDLISFLKAITDASMRKGISSPDWYVLLVAVLGILSKCENLRDLERFARRIHSVFTEMVEILLNARFGFGLSPLLPTGGRAVHLRDHP